MASWLGTISPSPARGPHLSRLGDLLNLHGMTGFSSIVKSSALGSFSFSKALVLYLRREPVRTSPVQTTTTTAMQLKDLLPAGLLLNNLFDKAEKAEDHTDGRITTPNTKQVELGDVMFFHKDVGDLKRLLATTGSDSVSVKKLPKTDIIIVKRTTSSGNSVNDAVDAAAIPVLPTSPTATASTSSASPAAVSDASDFSKELRMPVEVEAPKSSTTSSSDDMETLPDEEEAVMSDLSENDVTCDYDVAPEIQPTQLSARDTKSKTPGVFPWRNRLCRCVSIGAIFGNKDDRMAKSDEPLPPYEEGVSIFNWGNGVCKCVPMDDAFGDHTMAALGLAIGTVE